MSKNIFKQKDCPAKNTVKVYPYGTSSSGYSCGVTGGHCLPDKDCDSRRETHERYSELNRILEQANAGKGELYGRL